MYKYKYSTYHKGYFSGVSDIYINLITCDNKIVTLSILQSYMLHWYYTDILRPVMDRIEAMILQNFYYSSIRDAVRKELKNCDTCQLTK